jgi:hypothetical protein
MEHSGRANFGAFIPGPRCRRAPTASGSLDGLTFAVKDLIDVAGTPTGGGNPDWLKTQSPAAPTWSAKRSPTNSHSASKVSTRITARRSIRHARIGFPADRRADRR